MKPFLITLMLLCTAPLVAQTDSLITTDTIPDLAISTTTYKMLLKQPAAEKYIYSVTSENITYDGSYTVEEKKKHFSVFKFYDKKTQKQYYLLYDYRTKLLFQTDWFDRSVVGDVLLVKKVNFKELKAQVLLGGNPDSKIRMKLFQIPDQL